MDRGMESVVYHPENFHFSPFLGLGLTLSMTMSP